MARHAVCEHMFSFLAQRESWNSRKDSQVILTSFGTIVKRSFMFTSSVFDATRKTKEAFQLHGKGDILIGQGVAFDTIKYIGSFEFLVTSPESIPQGGPTGIGAYKSTLRYISEIYLTLFQNGHEISDFDTFLDTICAIALCGRQRTKDRKIPKSTQKGLQVALLLAPSLVTLFEMGITFIDLFLKALTSLHRPDDTVGNKKLATEFQLSAWEIFERCLRCSTQKRYFGQVLPNARVGDKIVILKGCEVPSLLREVSDH